MRVTRGARPIADLRAQRSFTRMVPSGGHANDHPLWYDWHMEEKKKILSPVLKVRGRDEDHYGAWKLWWPVCRGWTFVSRVEGPAIIYQNGRIRWRQP